MKSQLEHQKEAWPEWDFTPLFEPYDYICFECKHTEFRIVYTPRIECDFDFTSQDLELLGKPDACQKCHHKKLHEKRFWWLDLPLHFVIEKISHLKNGLSAQATYRVANLISCGSIGHVIRRSSQRKIIGEFYLKSARLGSKNAMYQVIRFYIRGEHFNRNFLRAMIWYKRVKGLDGLTKPELVESFWESGFFRGSPWLLWDLPPKLYDTL